MSIRPEHLIGAAMAIGVLGLALADGGYAAEARAALTVLVWAAVLASLLFRSVPRGAIGASAFIAGGSRAAPFIAGGSLAALTILAGASVGWASDDGRAFAEAVRIAGYLGLFILVVLLSGPEGSRPWLTGLGLGILAVAAIALLSRLLPGFPGGDEEIAALLPSAAGRLSYPIGYWNALAALVALGVVTFAWLSAEARTLAGRALSVGVLPALGLVLYLTSSRGGLAASALGLIGLVLGSSKRAVLTGGIALGAVGAGTTILLASRETELLDGLTDRTATEQGVEVLAALIAAVFSAAAMRAILDRTLSRVAVPRRVGPAIAALGVIAATALIAISGPGERLEDFKRAEEPEATESGFVSAHLASGSGSGRYQFWGEALDAFGSEPARGVGAGGFEGYWAVHATITRSVRDAHSLYLEMLAELGPAGLLALIGFLVVAPAVALWQRAPGVRPTPEHQLALALVVTGAFSAGIEWTWEVPVAFAPVVVTIALLTGPASLQSGRRPAGERSARHRRLGGLVAVAAIGCVCLIGAADSFLTERSLSRSRSAVADEKLDVAANRARDAIALQPFAAEPRLQLALVQEAAGELRSARETVAEAIERSPRDWRIWLAHARIETEAGDVAAGRRSLRHSRRLNPRNPLFAPIQRTPDREG